ncbi:MAG: S8 family serine peptidase, partial [Clostridia bacterium]|nr:S8 family serine peptidase [Clostridia bacterium]
MKKTIIYLLVIVMVCMISVPVFAANAKASIGINVLLNSEINDDILKALGKHGKVLDVLYEIDALTMRAKISELDEIKALPFVKAANPDAERTGAPVDTVDFTTFDFGFGTWNLDAINVTNPGPFSRVVNETGEGVYIAVLDTGLLDSWRQYFPEEKIAVEYAKSFTGGPVGNVADQPNKWEHDVDSHGTHVTSTILGYSLFGDPINGVAPNAKVIPVKVLNQNGNGWSSIIAKGISYIASLKEEGGPLADYPVVINMSLGGPRLDAVEQAAIDRAIEAGVIIVASAGNRGEAGMGYPGAYEPVISVASAGWAGEWVSNNWWYAIDDPDPTLPFLYYISDFSGRVLPGQDLDVAAPGSWVLGPYQVNRGQTSYYFMGGTSMACPHVAGVVALMAEKYSALDNVMAESILESTALYLAPGSLTVLNP